MIKFYTGFTKEIDNAEAAVREICEQLNPSVNALENTIGIIHFYYEFAETGVCQAIIDALPFEVAGCVSSYSAAGGEYGDIALCVTMITSDGADFSIRILEEVDKKSRELIFDEISQLCEELCAEEKPKMVMPFIPPLQHFGGDELVSFVNALPDPFPMFGTISFNTEDKKGSNVVVGGGKISSAFAFIAFYGDVEPTFHVTTAFAFDESFGGVAEITESDGLVLKKINDVTALNYLREQGVITSDNAVVGSGIWAIPAILTYPNGTKVVRAFLGVVEGTEFIISTGKMEVGTYIKFAFVDGDKTLSSAENLIKDLFETKKTDVIAYSCAARAWSLGAKFFAEAQKIAECAEGYQFGQDDPFNYSVAYSGGEICPVLDNTGKLVNALHNYTLIACSFN